MSRIHASAERIIDAEPSAVWAAITDYNGKRPQFLPEKYREYRVERSPDGQDTVLSYTLHAGGRERPYQMQVEAATPGELLVERDLASTYTTHWQVERVGSGAHARVRLSSEWESRALGINGFFEQTRQLGEGGTKVGRNDPCFCGSGKKFKKCCGRH